MLHSGFLLALNTPVLHIVAHARPSAQTQGVGHQVGLNLQGRGGGNDAPVSAPSTFFRSSCCQVLDFTLESYSLKTYSRILVLCRLYLCNKIHPRLTLTLCWDAVEFSFVLGGNDAFLKFYNSFSHLLIYPRPFSRPRAIPSLHNVY